METFEVVMIGNSAVGKTSMLAALSNELDSFNLSGKVALEPTTHEFKLIQDQWNEMTAQVESQSPFTTLSTGIGGTVVDFVDHEFYFKVDGSNKARVLFTDTRGTLTGELDERLIARVNNAFGVFCVVDASVLMECPASRNAEYNCPAYVKKLFRDVYCDDDDKQPRFVAFVLTKCEKYMATQKGQRELFMAFHKVYGNIVDMLKKVKAPPHTYVLAIQTMTCVSFLKLGENGWPQFRVLPAKELKTKDCAYPLIILLKNIVETLDGNVGFFGRIFQALGFMTDLRVYRAELESKVQLPALYEEL